MKNLMKKLSLLVLVFAIMIVTTGYAKEPTMPSGIPLSQLKTYIDEFSVKHIGMDTAGAAIAVIKDDNVLVREDFGLADIENNIPVDESTVFEWGSTSKILVYISIMQLVEEGKLSLDEDIPTYLPDGFLKKLQYDGKITILNLMHHNAGWSDNIRDMMYDDSSKIKSLKEQLEIYEPKQIFPVGEGVGYSNFGIGLAGYIVERVSGEPYYEYVQTHILDVLDMKDTNLYYNQTDANQVEERRNQIKGYSTDLTEEKRLYVAIYPAGSVIGTLDDMVKLVLEINPKSTKNLLFKNKDTLSMFLSNTYSIGESLPGFAHGLFEKEYAVDTVGHAGHTNAFSAEVTFSPESGYAYVALANQDHESAMCLELEGLIFGNSEIESYKGELPDASQVVGYYKNYRSMFTGFEQWLSSPVRITYIDKNHISYNNYVAEQIRPYTFIYKDNNNLTQTIYFDMDGKVVKKMAIISASEWFPVSAFSANVSMIIMILSGVLALYFVLTLLVRFFQLIKDRGFKERKFLYSFILAILSLVSIINTVSMYVMIASFTSQEALSIHFAYNIVYIGLVTGILILSIRNEISISLSYIASIIWCIMIGMCQFYH